MVERRKHVRTPKRRRIKSNSTLKTNSINKQEAAENADSRMKIKKKKKRRRRKKKKKNKNENSGGGEEN
jgi:hypothetical protein